MTKPITADATDEWTKYFGGCPECGKQDEYLNVGRSHWAVCNRHKFTWSIGTNLFSSWHEETQADWRRNAEKLASYREVNPIYPEPTEEQKRQRAEHQRFSDECQRVDKGFGVEFGPDGIRALGPDDNPFALDDVGGDEGAAEL